MLHSPFLFRPSADSCRQGLEGLLQGWAERWEQVTPEAFVDTFTVANAQPL